MENIDRQLIADFIDSAVNDHSKAELLVQRHPELREARWVHDETILHFLAVEFYTDAVRFLGRLSFDVNTTNEFGDSPLIDVVSLGNLEMAEVLLSLGADPNAVSKTRDNPLHIAVQLGNAELADLLLGAGAKSDYVTDLNETVFDVLPSDRPQRDLILAALRKYGIPKVPG